MLKPGHDCPDFVHLLSANLEIIYHFYNIYIRNLPILFGIHEVRPSKHELPKAGEFVSNQAVFYGRQPATDIETRTETP